MSAIAATDIRALAAERFAELGWPTPRVEAWKYTNLAPVAKIPWRTDETARDVDTPLTFGARAAIELVFVNGRLLRQSGERFAAPAGERTWADWERNAMVALNFANMQEGARIEIPAGQIFDGFIHLLFVGSGREAAGHGDYVWSHPHNVIVAGANSQVAVVETFVGTGSYFTNVVTEIEAREGAVVDHYRLQCESLEAYHVGNVYIHQERAANVTSRSVAIGSAIGRSEVHVTLAGEGAAITLDGLFVGTGKQHLDNHTVIDHVKPHCESHELYKGVLDQNARGVFDGRIIVRPDAQKTVSRQENRNLLLSESAIVDSKPTLEIHNDDVKCNHGSTIGQIEQEPLFYLRSRGIGEEEARSLLIYAFASEIVDRMKIPAVSEQVGRALFSAMPERLPERRGGVR